MVERFSRFESIITLLVVAGCAVATERTSLPQPITDAIAVCSAGISASQKASLEAAYKLAPKEGSGKLSAGWETNIEGAFFRGVDRTNANVQKEYLDYLGCIKNHNAG